MTMEVDGTRHTGPPRKSWWDCVDEDMKSLGPSQEDIQFRNKCRRKIKGQLAYPCLPGICSLKWCLLPVVDSLCCRTSQRIVLGPVILMVTMKCQLNKTRVYGEHT